jgi:hypothetical protein
MFVEELKPTAVKLNRAPGDLTNQLAEISSQVFNGQGIRAPIEVLGDTSHSKRVCRDGFGSLTLKLELGKMLLI